MSTKLYVGNLSFNTTTEDLTQLFSQSGTVTSTSIIADRETGNSRGFGFVEMADRAEANTAIRALDGLELDGRRLVVNEARDSTRSGSDNGSSRRSY